MSVRRAVPAEQNAADGSYGRQVRKQLQIACATAHGVGAGMSANELTELVLERGLPSREEREKILQERLEGSYEVEPEVANRLVAESKASWLSAGDDTIQRDGANDQT